MNRRKFKVCLLFGWRNKFAAALRVRAEDAFKDCDLFDSQNPPGGEWTTQAPWWTGEARMFPNVAPVGSAARRAFEVILRHIVCADAVLLLTAGDGAHRGCDETAFATVAKCLGKFVVVLGTESHAPEFAHMLFDLTTDSIDTAFAALRTRVAMRQTEDDTNNGKVIFVEFKPDTLNPTEDFGGSDFPEFNFSNEVHINLRAGAENEGEE